MAGSLSPSPWLTFVDAAGVPYAGGKVYTYDTGTTTKRSTFSDAALTVANANPTILDSAGRGVFYLSPTAYAFVLAPSTDSDPPSSPIKTVDPVGAVPATNVDLDVTGVAGENIAIGNAVFMSSGLGGLTAGRWYLARADQAYGSVEAPIVGFATVTMLSGTSGAIRLQGRITGSSGLTAGTTYYASLSTPGGLQASAPPNSRRLCVADSATSFVIAEKRSFAVERVGSFGTTVGNVGTGEDNIAVFAGGPNELWADGMTWSGTFWGVTANNANVKRLRLKVNDATPVDALDFTLTINELGRWHVTFEIKRFSSTQFVSVASCMVGPGGGPTSKIGTNVFGSGSPGGCIWQNNPFLVLTAEATATNDIQVYGGTIYRVN